MQLPVQHVKVLMDLDFNAKYWSFLSYFKDGAIGLAATNLEF